MIRTNRRSGYTLIELLVVMTIFSIIIVAASQMFVGLLRDAKTQARIAETNIEGIVGLELMQHDVLHAGYGIYKSMDPVSVPTPSSPPAFARFTEITSDPALAALNDSFDAYLPRPLVFGGGLGLNDSDRIVTKSVNAASNIQSEHWTYLYSVPGSTTNTINTWDPSTENIGSDDYVVVLKPDQDKLYLMFASNGTSTTISSQYKDVLTRYSSVDSTSVILDLGTTQPPRMPFNRADFYLDNSGVPPKCAPGTGVLFKAVADQRVGSTGFLPAIPLLDCVADMQVAYRYVDALAGLTESNVTGIQPPDVDSSQGIREVRIYMLVQEGQRDNTYSYPWGTVRVGEGVTSSPTSTIRFGRDFHLDSTVTDWQHYRWKLYTLVINPLMLLPEGR